MFEKFKGISKEREITQREKNKLEVLLGVQEDFVREHNKLKDRGEYDACGYIYNRLEHIDFNEEDLRSLILANVNCDSKEISFFQGVYSGHLLSLLTERNKAKGQGTRFYINGQGNKINYLFYEARHVDELIVENFKGDNICSRIGIGGSANLVIGKEIQGEAAFDEIGINGIAKLVIGKDIVGDYAFRNVGESGNVGLVMGINIKGNRIFSCAGVNRGYVGTIFAQNLSGKQILKDSDLGRKKIKLVIDQVNDYCISFDGFTIDPDIIKNELFFGLTYISRESMPRIYEKALRQYKINEMLELIESMNDKNKEEIIEIGSKINSVFKSAEEKLW